MHKKLILIGFVGLAVVALIAGAVLSGSGPDRPATPVGHAADGHDHAGDPAHQKPAYVRTLVVYTDREPGPSAHPRRMRALLKSGRLPDGVVDAVVVTDEDCAPDRHGVSHCRNKLRLPNGRTVTVRHPHRMQDVPCMTPGETVRVGRAAEA